MRPGFKTLALLGTVIFSGAFILLALRPALLDGRAIDEQGIAVGLVALGSFAITTVNIYRDKGKKPTVIHPPRVKNIDESIKIYFTKLRHEFEEKWKPEEYVTLRAIEQPRTLSQQARERVQANTTPQHIDIRKIMRTASKNKLVLVGDPGCGKSVVLDKICCILMEDYEESFGDREKKAYLPLRIDLGNSDNPVNARELVEHWWKKSGIQSDLDQLLESGNLFLLLDGLNEMPDNNIRNRHIELRHFLNAYGEYRGPAVVTCRIADYYQDLDLGLPVQKIIELDAPEILNFADRLEGRATEFIEALMARSERLALSTNALALDMMIRLFKQQNNYELPDSRRELYSEYIKKRYDYNKQHTQGRSRVRKELSSLEKSWGRLAYNMMLAGLGNNIDMAIAEKYTESWLQRVKLKIFTGASNIDDGLSLAILKSTESHDGPHTKKLSFYHRALYEYFVIPYVDLTNGNLETQERLIKQLEYLGEIALPALPMLTDIYLTSEDKDLRYACHNAMISIALSTGSELGVSYTLSIMLDTAMRLFHYLGRENSRTMSMDLVYSLRNGFQIAINKTKSFEDIIVYTRRRELVGAEAFMKLRSQREESAISIANKLSDLLKQDTQSRKVEIPSNPNERMEDWLAGANIAPLREAQDLTEQMTEPSNHKKQNAANIIVALAEARFLMDGEIFNKPRMIFENARKRQKEIRQDIRDKAAQLSNSQ